MVPLHELGVLCCQPRKTIRDHVISFSDAMLFTGSLMLQPSKVSKSVLLIIGALIVIDNAEDVDDVLLALSVAVAVNE